MKRFAEALRMNTNLRSLGLSAALETETDVDGPFDDMVKFHQVRQLISRVVREGLQCLNLAHRDIGDVGALEVAAAVERCSALLSLDLSYCRIGDAGAIRLATALKKNLTLMEVSLVGNAISNVGVSHLE